MLIGIDQGTSGTTCAAFDERLKLVATSYCALPSDYPRPGWIEQDPHTIIASVSESVASVLAQIGGASRVKAVGLANQGETVVPWDAESGEPLSPAIVWSDQRSSVIVDRLSTSGHDGRIAQRTGLPLEAYFCGAKYAWLLENVPAVDEARSAGTLRLGTLDSWIGWNLSGRNWATDESTASRSQLVALGTGRWCEELLDAFGVPPDALARIVPTMRDFGDLGHQDWSGPLPWRASLIDQAASLAGHGCFAEGEMKVTYGTGAFVVVNGGQNHRAPPEDLLTMVAWSDLDRRTHAFDGGAFTAGRALQWLQSVGIIADPEECSGLAEAAGKASGVRFLPALIGLGAPWWRDASRGAFTGLTAGTTRGHLVAAVLDGIAFRVRDLLEAAWRAGYVRPARLRVDGGLTNNRYLMQRQADVLGLPVEVSPNLEATALGAAALAGITTGVVTETEVRSLVAGGEVIEPRQRDGPRESDYQAWRAWLASLRTNPHIAGA